MELANRLIEVAKNMVSERYREYADLEPGYDDDERTTKYREYIAVRNLYYAMQREVEAFLNKKTKK